MRRRRWTRDMGRSERRRKTERGSQRMRRKRRRWKMRTDRWRKFTGRNKEEIKEKLEKMGE